MDKKVLWGIGAVVIVIAILVGVRARKGSTDSQDKSTRASAQITPSASPSLFSQSGVVTAISATSLTIRYTVGDTNSTIAFPLLSSTSIRKIIKQSMNGGTVFREISGSISDITVGATVAVQIASKELKAIPPLKVQVFPK